MQSMLSLLRTRAAKTPDRVVLNDIGGATYSYGAFCREALRCADALERLGVGRGEAVATMLPTGADAFVLQAACSYLGATNVPVSTLMRGNPLSHVLNASRATTLVTLAGLPDLQSGRIVRGDGAKAGYRQRPRVGESCVDADGIRCAAGARGSVCRGSSDSSARSGSGRGPVHPLHLRNDRAAQARGGVPPRVHELRGAHRG